MGIKDFFGIKPRGNKVRNIKTTTLNVMKAIPQSAHNANQARKNALKAAEQLEKNQKNAAEQLRRNRERAENIARQIKRTAEKKAYKLTNEYKKEVAKLRKNLNNFSNYKRWFQNKNQSQSAYYSGPYQGTQFNFFNRSQARNANRYEEKLRNKVNSINNNQYT